MALNSGTVAAGDQALPAQYNNLRKDVILYSGDFAATTGSANAYVLALDAQITALVDGMVVKCRANFTNTGVATLNLNGLGAKTIKQFGPGSTKLDVFPGDIPSGADCILMYDSSDTTWQLLSPIRRKAIGQGTGSDGALAVAAGTTTIDCTNKKVVVKNYSSVNITGGTLAFSNPHAGGTTVILRVLGDFVQSAGLIDGSAMGAAGGTGGIPGSGGAGTNANGIFDALAHGGGGGVQALTSQTAGSQGVQLSPTNIYMNQAIGAFIIAPGSGGGGGGAGSRLGGGGFQEANGTTGGVGGRGGIALIIICEAFNFSGGTISVAGQAGGNGTNAAAGGGGGRGGGGGAGGMFWGLYRTLVSNAGTYTTTGGAPGSTGTNADANGTNGGLGGGAGSLAGAGSAGTGAAGSTTVEQNSAFI